MYGGAGNNDRFAERRMHKNKARQQKWVERQERSKLSREDIDLLQMKRADLRRELDDCEAAKEATMNATEKAVVTAKRDKAGGDSGEDENVKEERQYLYFNELPLSQRTQMGLERGNYKKMTPIQSDSLHLALAGYDVLGAAKTGSGKTLCFVIPVLEQLFLEHWDAEMGVGAILLSPTRELALQIFKVIQVVGYKHVLSAALLTGGRDVQEERKRLHAINIIVGTPGRILHHLQDDASLVLDNLQLLCMDEADRLLDMGFRECVTSILQYLPPQRQTLMFSATQTTDVHMLAQMSLHNPRYVTSQTITSSPMPSTLCQNFIIVELHRKLDVLLMFLKRHPNDKVVVFLSTCNQVKFMYQAFSKILKKMRIPSMCLTSKMKQFRREEVFLTFCRCKSAVLFCTDVAARGLDFPLVHWVVQYDCPDSAQTYIHRAGRTARAGARGVNLLFLTVRETPMLSYLANKNVVLREITVKPSFMHDSHDIFVALVVQGLKYEAQKAFIAYLRSVYFASNKHVFDVASIEVEAFAKSLGLLVVPDMSELQKLQRGAKNLPWDVVNYIAKRERIQARKQQKAASAEKDEGEGEGDPLSDRDGSGSASDEASVEKQQLTRKEKHLQASDMFRMLQQKQKFAQKNANDEDDSDGDGFLVKKMNPSPASTGKGGDSNGKDNTEGDDKHMKLTIEERLAGLSKSKRRKFIENPDIRVRDLGLNTRIIYNSDDDDDEEEDADTVGNSKNSKKPSKGPRVITGVAPEDAEDYDEKRIARIQAHLNSAVAARDSSGSSSSNNGSDDEHDEDEDGSDDDGAVGGGDYFAQKLRRRMQGQKETDGERAKKLRRLRKLQKSGRLSKKQTLESSGVTSLVGGPRPKNSDEDEEQRSNEYIDDVEDDSESDVGGGGSLARLIKAAKGELYPADSDEDGHEEQAVHSKKNNRGQKQRNAQQSVDSEDDDDNEDYVYHGIDSSEDNDSGASDDEEEKAKPVPKRRRV